MVGTTNTKSWFKSKTMWAAIILGLGAVYQVVSTGAFDLVALQEAGAALGLFGLRDSL